MTRIVLIDERAMVREGIARQLATASDLEVLADVSECREALSLGRSAEPDVVIMSADGDGVDVFTAAESLRGTWPQVCVIIILRVLRDAILSRATLSGVDGIVTTRDSIATLQTAIRAAARGRRFHSKSVWSRLVELSSLGASRPRTRASRLTTREFQVLFHLAGGCTIRQTAQVMALSPRTVENHKSRLMKRLDIHSGIGLVRFAFREGMIVP